MALAPKQLRICWKSDELVSICMSAGNTMLLVIIYHCYSKGFVICIRDSKGKKHQWWKWLKQRRLHWSPTSNVQTWSNWSTFNLLILEPFHLDDKIVRSQLTISPELLRLSESLSGPPWPRRQEHVNPQKERWIWTHNLTAVPYHDNLAHVSCTLTEYQFSSLILEKQINSLISYVNIKKWFSSLWLNHCKRLVRWELNWYHRTRRNWLIIFF